MKLTRNTIITYVIEDAKEFSQTIDTSRKGRQ